MISAKVPILRVTIRGAIQLQPRAFLASSASVNLSEQHQVDPLWETALPYKKVPGPNLFQLINYFRPGGSLNGKLIFEVEREFRKRYGKLARLPGLFGKPDIVFVYEPEDMEKAFRTEGVYPVREGLESIIHFRKELRQDVFKKGAAGLAVEQGESWWKFRQAVNPIMMKPKTTKLYVPKMDEISTDMLDKLHNRRGANGEVPEDFLVYLNKWALESVCYISLDIRIGLLGDKENPTALQFMNTLKLFFEYSYKMDILPSAWKWYKGSTYNAAMKNMHEMTDLALHFLELGKQDLEKKKKESGSDRETGVLEKLLEIDENVALTMTLDSIVAGVDTTSSSFFQLLYALALHPEKQELLRNETMNILPEKDSKLTAENWQNMPYLRACMKESARYAPIFDNFRSAGRDIVMQGYQIPKKTMMLLATELQLKNEEQYQNCEEFIPERFLRNEAKECPVKDKANPFTFLPFGFGPRMCIGRRFAELEMETLICRLIRRYRVAWNGPPPQYITALGKIAIGKTYFVFEEVKE